MRRLTSYNVLVEVLKKDRHAHLVLKELDLKSEDQAFVSALVYTTLQHRLFLDYQFADFVDKKLPLEIRIILLMGCAQYFKMDRIPDYALVDESVNLAKKIGMPRFAGVVNAVLKKVIQRGERPIEGDEMVQASITYSMPLWILKLLSKQYDKEYAIAYAQYCQEIKPSYVRVNTLKPLPEEAKLLFDDAFRAQPDLFKSPYLADAHLIVQDINSQKVVGVMDLEEGMSVLDCCCGPGTKTTQIAAELNNTGHIDGIELHASRAQVTTDLLARANVTNADIHISDVRDWETDKTYDRILLDAPCSGLGVLAHKHDLRYHIQPSDLDDLIILQEEMLDHVAPMVSEGGLLVYATCTLNRKENDRQIEAFLKRNDQFELDYEETLNPMETMGDGFYIAKLRRTC